MAYHTYTKTRVKICLIHPTIHNFNSPTKNVYILKELKAKQFRFKNGKLDMLNNNIATRISSIHSGFRRRKYMISKSTVIVCFIHYLLFPISPGILYTEWLVELFSCFEYDVECIKKA